MRRALTLAILAGVLAGAAGAATRADRGDAHASAALAFADPIPISMRPQDRLPDGRFSPSYVHYRTRNARIVARTPDPAGGPDWALRIMDADRITIKRPARTLAGGRVVGRERCAQLGRVSGSTFGWVYGDGRFRAAGIEDQLLQCTSRKRPRLVAQLASTLTISDPANPAISGAVVWGIAPGAVAATVTGTGGADGPAAVDHDGVLRLGNAQTQLTAGARVQAGKHSVALAQSLSLPPSFGGKLKFPTPIAGSGQIEAPAPDPDGGPGYGLPVVQTREGVPCVGQPVQIAGGRGGGVDLRLALFTEHPDLSPASCRPLETNPARMRPCDVGYGGGDEDIEGNDAFLERARVERRVLAGRTMVNGQCSADVIRVSITTPRDIRTLIPSPIGHAFLAVYDGDFPAGTLVITAQLRSGKTWTQRLPLGF